MLRVFAWLVLCSASGSLRPLTAQSCMKAPAVVTCDTPAYQVAGIWTRTNRAPESVTSETGYVFRVASGSRSTEGKVAFLDSAYVDWQGPGPAPSWGLASRSGWNAGIDMPDYGKGVVGWGSGWAHWLTNVVGRPAGLYVDTLTIPGSATQFVDSVRVVGNTARVVTPPVAVAPSPRPVSPQIPAAASAPPPPRPPVAYNAGQRARVWMTSARLAFVRTQAAANSPRWQKVKTAADAQLRAGAPASIGLLPALCLTYLVTGASTYASRAGVILDANTDATALVKVRGDNAYPYRSTLTLITKGLDWCRAGLTTAQRQRAATWLMDAADWVWPETNAARKTGWAVTNPGNNYFWGFMTTGAAALAAAGDDTKTGPVSGSDRPAYHQKLALAKWNDIALPFFAGRDAGGAWLEGTGYESSGNVASFVDAFATSGTQLSTPWLADALRWHLHYTMPNGKNMAPLGDQARVSSAPIYIYNRTSMELVRAVVPDATLAGEAQTWLDWIGQLPYALDDGSGLTTELLLYDPAAAHPATLAAVPRCFVASGMGMLTCRQNWTDPNATAFVFHSGPSPDHMARDANDLMIWKGTYWVSGGANIYSTSGIVQQSQAFNVMTLGSAGQALYSANAGTIVGTPVLTDSLVVIRGQAKDTYGYPAGTGSGRTVTDATRTVVYLPALDAFVIVDRATAVDPTQVKVWRWHTRNVAPVSASTFTLANPNGDQRCVGNVLTPATVGAQAMQYGNPGITTSNAVTVTPVGLHASDQVVTVMQCSEIAPLTLSTTPSVVSVTIGATRVRIPTDPASAVTIGSR